MNISLNGPAPATSIAGLPQVLQTPLLKLGGSRCFLNEMLPAFFNTRFQHDLEEGLLMILRSLS